MARYKFCPDCNKRLDMEKHPQMFCDNCRKAYGRAKTKRRKTSQRAIATDAFKDDLRWKPLRQIVLLRDQFSCQTHYRCGVVVAHQSNPVDHIVPRDVMPELTWEADNCETLCPSCHNRKTYWEGQGFVINWRFAEGRWVVFGGSQRSLVAFSKRTQTETMEVMRSVTDRFCLVVDDRETAFATARDLQARPFELLR